MTITAARFSDLVSLARKINMTVYFSLIVVLAEYPASAAAALPIGYKSGSQIEIDYSDWNRILQSVVMVTGGSDRRPADKVKSTVSRIPHANPNVTRIEGNRVFYHEFSPEHTTTLVALRRSLEAVSEEISLTDLSRSQQLAYWLNLHNVAVMAAIAEQYPIKYLRQLIEGTNATWDDKTMWVAGENISIRDIENHVIENWNDPLVLYGFYMGAVGGPNVLDIAFTGNNVRDLLIENAEEFVNSLRGVRFWGGHAKISKLYAMGARYFLEFDSDVKAHLMRFAKPQLKQKISEFNVFRAASFDWYIADLLNGDTYQGSSHRVSVSYGPEGGIDGVNSGAFGAGSNAAFAHMPPHVRDLLIGIKKRNLRRQGRVKVEEVDHGTSAKNADAEQPESEQHDVELSIYW